MRVKMDEMVTIPDKRQFIYVNPNNYIINGD